jgi:predicted ATP-grasp superfamily ATP-dependent carboligase
VAIRSEPRRGPAKATLVATRAAGAVVYGSDYRALGIVRSLGRRGIPVLVLSGGDDTLAARSRYATDVVPLPEGCDPTLLLCDLAERFEIAGRVLFPTADESAAVVARAHDVLAERFLLASPPWETFRWAYDKRMSNAMAARAGVPHPRTWSVSSADEAARLDLAFPVIIKPAVKESFNALTAAKAWRVDSRQDLRQRFSEAVELLPAEVLMIQELIPGSGKNGDGEQLSYAALCRRGAPLAALVARRARQYPPDFGRASTFVETIDDPEVEEMSRRLLGRLGLDGLVEVEFKRDPRDGELKLLDVNARVWGWHTLAQRAGVDFPYLAYRLARGEEITDRPHARTGERWLRLSTDLPSGIRQVLRGSEPVVPYLQTLFSRHESAIFARDDPWPAVVEFPLLFTTLVRRLRRGTV